MYAIDISFLLDIIVTFNTAFYDQDNDLIDDRHTIAQSYLFGWFTIDLVAIIPFEVLLKGLKTEEETSGDLNPLIRIARFGKLYKLVKLIRLVRMLKIMKVMKNKNHVVKKLNKLMDLDLGCERLFFIFLIILMINHISACLWIILATMTTEDDTNYAGTWLASFYADGMKDAEQLYMVAFYWATTTITTVGYGDISGTNNTERVFCAIIMLFGVIAFSFANGSMTSIIQNVDSNNAKYEQQVSMLNDIYKDYCLPLELFNRIKKTIGYKKQKDMANLLQFVNDLPEKLRIEVSLYIYESRYTKIKFFKHQKNTSFISWICALLEP